MNKDKFVNLREYVYHLTNPSNLSSILSDRKLKSTKILTQIINLEDRDIFLRTRRLGHKEIGNNSYKFSIRDQDPLHRNVAEKNLAPGFIFEDLVYLLNSKVFLWAKWKDLLNHYSRYEKQGEKPLVFKIRTSELFEMNNEPKFCHLNSGAPRCSAAHNGFPAPRSRDLFLCSERYERTPSSVREVTFDEECFLPHNVYISDHPDKSFKKV